MSVEFVPAAHVRDLTQRIQAARQRALERCSPPGQLPDAPYWEAVFEVNAAEVLAALPAVALQEGFVVRYRFFGQHGHDLLVRPFVARSGTDIDSVRRLLEWHPSPDSIARVSAAGPTRDVDLLYRYFSFPSTASGVFEYWLAMQEVWASARWTHSHLIASAEELSQITAAQGWEIMHPVEQYEPAVVRGAHGARLAVLVECPLQHFQITLQQIEIGTDQALSYGESVLVASGPRGYLT